jgi:hypothetical protein
MLTRWLGLIALTTLAACASTVDNDSYEAKLEWWNELAEIEWWNEPGEIKDAMAVVGSSKIRGNIEAARHSAEADARAKMAQTVQVTIQLLVTDWSKEADDNLDDATLSSYINEESLVRQMTDIDIVGARPVKYKQVDGYFYVLMVMEDPAKWTAAAAKSLRDLEARQYAR